MHSNFQLLLFVKDQGKSLSEKLLDNILDSLCDDLHNCNRLTPLEKKRKTKKNPWFPTQRNKDAIMSVPHIMMHKILLGKKLKKSNTEDQILLSSIKIISVSRMHGNLCN